MPIFVLLMIAISLSMDAFSLALAYGTLQLEKKDVSLLSSIVGMYHFFMPLLGFLLGSLFLHIIRIDPKLVVFIILSFIGLEMILDSFKQEEVHVLKWKERFLFGLAVSMDSFSVGIGLKTITEHIFLAPFLFSICSFLFTYLGLRLGTILSQKFGKISTLIGGVVLILIGIRYLF